jgi:hypothetical protein
LRLAASTAVIPRQLLRTLVDLDLPDQLLVHQDLVQVTWAKDAWPLRLG